MNRTFALPLLLMVMPAYVPPEVVEIVKMGMTMIVVIALGVPIIRAFTRRLERGSIGPAPTSPDVVARLERIEQAVDSVAIEVERIAEAQRFSAKLLAQRSDAAGLLRSGT